MTAKEQFNKILNDASINAIGRNFKGALDCYGHPTISEIVLKAMEATLDLGKSESEATIENLASRIIELEAALQNIADATDGENPSDAVFYFAAINALKQTL